mmetsp:Transcript_14014/g.52372  ORF Transcript_14014/g.52372 Transcript_14014/m.52372 type:complete len:401 (+) Transcript_14014:333-1535(+)
MRKRRGRVRCRLGVANVVDKEVAHGAQAELLVHHFHGTKSMHLSVGSRKRCILRHGGSRSGGRNVTADDVAVLPRHHRSPVLDALAHDVVGALLGDDAIDEAEGADRNHLVALQEPQRLEHFLPCGCLPVVLLHALRRLRGDHVRVRRRAQARQDCVAPRFAHLFDDAVAGHGDLREERASQVDVRAHDELLSRAHFREPRPDLRSVGHEIGSALAGELVQLSVRDEALPVHALLDGEEDPSGADLAGVENLGPDERAIQVHADQVRAEAQEEVQRAHRTRRAKQHEVGVAQVQPLVLVLLHERDGLGNVGLDATVLDPDVELLAQLRAGNLRVPPILEACVGLADLAAVVEVGLVLARHRLGSAHLSSLVVVRAILAHRLLERRLLAVADEHEGLLSVV